MRSTICGDKAERKRGELVLTYTIGNIWRSPSPTESHITQESKYKKKAEQAINYAATSDRCLPKWQFT
ncbi:hypothetical protein NXX42_27215 [Bacteroides thetaiotaomicron]|nr:hypothetical protein [Bacteroides thetaiotaomicron]